MSDRITHASDGTPCIERDHPDEDAPDRCDVCNGELDDDGYCSEHGDQAAQSAQLAEEYADSSYLRAQEENN